MKSIVGWVIQVHKRAPQSCFQLDEAIGIIFSVKMNKMSVAAVPLSQ
jgi:hypothetical protein